MLVNLGKYSADIVFCAQEYFAPRKYISVVPKQIYLTAQKYLSLRGNI